MTAVDAGYGDEQTPALGSGAGTQDEPTPRSESAQTVSVLFPGVVLGRTRRVAPPDAEVADGGWYVYTNVARGDIMRGAWAAAAHQNKAQQVHNHPKERTTKKGKVKLVRCNEGCVVVQPDANWPGGSMGGRI